MGRHTFLYLAFLGVPIVVQAQETATNLAVDESIYQSVHSTVQEINPQLCDSTMVNLPTLNEYGQLPSLHFPYSFSYYCWPTWNLHKGLNASLSASIFSTFGSGNTWSGAGFTESASLMYALPLGKKFSAAIGGYIKNTSWAHSSFRSAGISAMLNYQVNERLNVYAYGQKSLLNSKQIPLPLWDMADIADRIGIGAEYKVSPSFSVGLSVDYNKYKCDNPWFGRYNPESLQPNREFPR